MKKLQQQMNNNVNPMSINWKKNERNGFAALIYEMGGCRESGCNTEKKLETNEKNYWFCLTIKPMLLLAISSS